MNMIPVILSGGIGSRLWPQSRSLYPKQFLALVNNQTMLQHTVSRLDGLASVTEPIVISNYEHRFLVAEQLRQISREVSSIILEPIGRNTAPAVALAAIKVIKTHDKVDNDPILLVLAADHVIRDTVKFHQTIEAALPAAHDGKLVIFGILPTHPETGYGYIKAGSQLIVEQVSIQDNLSLPMIYEVEQFSEKPNHETAQRFLASGDYYWNSGIFLFRASRYLEELNKYRPDILVACQKAMEVQNSDLDFVCLDEAAFKACPDESIDYAVMEKTSHSVVVPLDAGWSDVGSWSSVAEIAEKDEAGNSIIGDVLLQDTHNTYIRSEKKLIATVGVDDLIITESDDAILIAHKDKVQGVKKIVKQLRSDDRLQAKLHRKVYRSWGTYDSIESGDSFQVKLITVNPGVTLSFQAHDQVVCWILVKGTALITNADQDVLLNENQLTYIPIGTVHRLQNLGKFDVELIEVQSGSCLEGDDIIMRFDDAYCRK